MAATAWCSRPLAAHQRTAACQHLCMAMHCAAPSPRMHLGSCSLQSQWHGTSTLRRSTATRQAATQRRHAQPATAEISYIMVKPDGVQRRLVGEIIGRLERKGFTLRALSMFVPDKALAEEHYKDLSSKPFFNDLVTYICSGPVVAMVWEGSGVVKSARKLIGATNPLEADAGTIRGDLAIQTGRNVVHGSDSPENGQREAALWFGRDDATVSWDPALQPWLTE